MTDARNSGKTDTIEVVTPNLKRRLSGVTATIARLVPLQAKQIGIVATGPGLPDALPHISIAQLVFLPRRKLRVWHARRNTEMILGLILRHVIRLNLVLLFTSASQRTHTGFTRWLISQMDDVIATSQKTANYLERPATIIHHGINTQRFSPPDDRAALRADLKLPNGVLIGCYGRIRRQKGTDAFVDTMIDLLPAFPDHHALVMGRVTESHTGFHKSLKTRVADAGLSERIHFLPEVPVDQMAVWYQVLDLFVAPQRWEGFGLTPLEAMACGVPVVATRVGAFEELVDDGTTGTLVAKDNIPALTEAIRGFLEYPKLMRASGVAARDHCAANFTLGVEANRIIAVYRSLLDASVMINRPNLISIGNLIECLKFQVKRRRAHNPAQNLSLAQQGLLQELSGKTVAIVGNARALANTCHGTDIDAADIVIRINRAPRPARVSHGMKTDWLALATSLPNAQARKLKPSRILWMSPKAKRIPFWATRLPGFYQHPRTEWLRLNTLFGSSPTTGAMIIDLVKNSEANSIDLYGFDFFASKSLTGHRSADQVPHDFSTEKDFVNDIVTNDARFHLIPTTT